MLQPESSPKNGLFSRSQRREIFALSGLSLAIIVFSILQLRHNIISPFSLPERSKTASDVSLSSDMLSDGGTSTNPAVTRQADGTIGKDTDHDGISDADEANIYSTSPYLPDSDGDGFGDKEEVSNGTDPLCPAGKTCSSGTSITKDDSQAVSSASVLAGLIDQPTTVSTTTLVSNSEDILQQVLSGTSDPMVLRKLLIDNGMDKQQLDQISDEDLIRSYQETISQSKASSTTLINN